MRKALIAFTKKLNLVRISFVRVLVQTLVPTSDRTSYGFEISTRNVWNFLNSVSARTLWTDCNACVRWPRYCSSFGGPIDRTGRRS